MVTNEWDKHWSNEILSLNRFFKFYRKYVMSNALSFFFEKYFPREGMFVECGSGSSLTSYMIKKHKRKLIALDLSSVALQQAKRVRNLDFFIQANTLKLPLRSDSVDGIWNLGVMEHFTPEDIDRAMQEYIRVLKKGSYVILFWPPIYSSTGITYRIIERLLKIVTGKAFRFYPDEISRLRSKKEARLIMKRNGFRTCKVYFPCRNFFGDLVVVAKK